MRIYKIPFQTDFEDKIIGGYLTVRQFGFIVFLPIILSLPVYFILFFIPLVVKIMMTLFNIMVGIAFAFVKINGVYLEKYLLKMFRFFFTNRTILLHKKY